MQWAAVLRYAVLCCAMLWHLLSRRGRPLCLLVFFNNRRRVPSCQQALTEVAVVTLHRTCTVHRMAGPAAVDLTATVAGEEADHYLQQASSIIESLPQQCLRQGRGHSSSTSHRQRCGVVAWRPPAQVVDRLGASAWLRVRIDAGDGKGKGIFAAAAFKEGDVLFKESPLVSATARLWLLDAVAAAAVDGRGRATQRVLWCCTSGVVG